MAELGLRAVSRRARDAGPRPRLLGCSPRSGSAEAAGRGRRSGFSICSPSPAARRRRRRHALAGDAHHRSGCSLRAEPPLQPRPRSPRATRAVRVEPMHHAGCRSPHRSTSRRTEPPGDRTPALSRRNAARRRPRAQTSTSGPASPSSSSKGCACGSARNERWPAVTVAPYVSEARRRRSRAAVWTPASPFPCRCWNQNAGDVESREGAPGTSRRAHRRPPPRSSAGSPPPRNAYDTFLRRDRQMAARRAGQKFRDAARGSAVTS